MKNPPYSVSTTGIMLVAGEGFEPSKAEPGDLQSPPIGRSGNPPYELLVENHFSAAVMLAYGNKGGAMRPIHPFFAAEKKIPKKWPIS